MNKTIKGGLFLLIVTGLYAQFQTPYTGDRFQSFRFLSTSNILEDDLDYILNPATMTWVKQRLLFTSLSNFATNNDALFGNISSGYFMIGTKLNFLGNLMIAPLYDNYMLKSPEFNGIDTGYTEIETITHMDADSNGTFETQITEKESREAYNEWNTSDIYIGAGKDMGTFKAGLFFLMTSSGFKEIVAGSPQDIYGNFEYSYEIYDNEQGQRLQTETWDGTQDANYGTTKNIFAFSLLYEPYDLMFLNVMGGFGILSFDSTWSANTDYRLDWAPDDPVNNYESSNYTDELDLSNSGTLMFARLYGKRKWEYGGETYFYLDWRREGLSQKDGTKDSNVYYERRTNLGAFDEILISNSQTHQDITNDGNNNSWLLGVKHVIPVFERTFLGIGFAIRNRTGDRSFEIDETYTFNETYDDGDGVPDVDDYTLTATSSRTYEDLNSFYQWDIMVPVGCEIELRKNLFLRLGANSLIRMREDQNTINPLSSTPLVTTIVNGLGDTTTTYDTLIVDDGSTTIKKTKETITNYSFGLGWNVNKNITLDFMGFTNLVNLTNWRLSLKIKF
jgi:hypothetical protein